MTITEYFERLKEQSEVTDWNDWTSVHEYNEYARILRSRMEWEAE